MIVNLPRSEQALMKVTARARNWSKHQYVGRPFRVCEIVIPAEIAVEEVEVVAESYNRQGESVDAPVVLRAATKFVDKPKDQSIEDIAVEVKPSIDYSSQTKKKRVKRNQEITPAVESIADSEPSQGSASDNELG